MRPRILPLLLALAMVVLAGCKSTHPESVRRASGLHPQPYLPAADSPGGRIEPASLRR
jgi:hypothetical protein